MKSVYYIVAPTSSGKTTAAQRLSKRMEIPCYHADLVYNYLHEEYKTTPPAARLTDHTKWGDPRNFGIESWGRFKDMEDAKAPMFDRLIADKATDFIIEGFTLSFPSERNHVERAVGPHRAIILRIDMPFHLWSSFYSAKMGRQADRTSFDRLRSSFLARETDTVYTFSHPDALDVHLAEYQRPGFTDKKIEALKIPLRPGDVVNDVGCNAGEIGKWCLTQGAKLVRGYDVNWRFLDQAVLKGLEPHLGNVEAKPLHPADVTLCVSTFHYFKNPEAFLDKVRRKTSRVFVLEVPVCQADGLVSELILKTNPRHTRHSRNLIELWLGERFRKVECVGESVPPDKSYRLVFHAYV